MNDGRRMADCERPASRRAEGAGFARWATCILIYGGLAGLVAFGWLGATDVVSMEGIVGDGARHMARSGDYCVPHLYGQIYAYKPPMAYWLAWAALTVRGELTEWGLRFPIALTGFLLGLGVLMLIGRLLGPRTGCLCGLATVTGVLMIQKLRVAEFDVPLAAGTGIAMAAACVNLAVPRPRATLWMVGYLGLTFGLLAKGLPAVAVYAPGLVVAAIVARATRRLLSLSHLLGVALCVALVAMWAWGAWQSGGAEVFRQPWMEARTRGLDWSWQSLGGTAVKPLVVFVLFMPWSLLLPVAAARSWRARLEPVPQRVVAGAWGFLLAAVVVFMLNPTSSSRYYLPLCTPIGILAGMAAATDLRLLPRWHRFRWMTAHALAVLAAVGLLAGVLTPALGAEMPASVRAVCGVLAVAAVAVAVWLGALRDWTGLWHRRPGGEWNTGETPVPQDLQGRTVIRSRGPIPDQVALGVAVLCIWLMHTSVVQPHRATARSLRPVAASFDPLLPREAVVWTAVGDSHSSLFFYLRRPVQAFDPSAQAPPTEAFMVLAADEFALLERRSGLVLGSLGRAKHGGDEFVLARVGER